MTINEFLVALKAELAKKGDTFHFHHIDAAAATVLADPSPVTDNGELATALIGGAVDPIAHLSERQPEPDAEEEIAF